MIDSPVFELQLIHEATINEYESLEVYKLLEVERKDLIGIFSITEHAHPENNAADKICIGRYTHLRQICGKPAHISVIPEIMEDSSMEKLRDKFVHRLETFYITKVFVDTKSLHAVPY